MLAASPPTRWARPDALLSSFGTTSLQSYATTPDACARCRVGATVLLTDADAMLTRTLQAKLTPEFHSPTAPTGCNAPLHARITPTSPHRTTGASPLSFLIGAWRCRDTDGSDAPTQSAVPVQANIELNGLRGAGAGEAWSARAAVFDWDEPGDAECTDGSQKSNGTKRPFWLCRAPAYNRTASRREHASAACHGANGERRWDGHRLDGPPLRALLKPMGRALLIVVSCVPPCMLHQRTVQ